MFIGREEELNFLEDRYNSADGQLVVLYGRRRVGKTELLRQFCQDKEHIFILAQKLLMKNSLKRLVSDYWKKSPGGKIYYSLQ